MDKEELMKLHPITWVEEEKMCRWRGMHSDEYQSLIGTDSELYDFVDGKYYFIGRELFINLPFEVEGIELVDITTISPYSDLKRFNLNLLKELTHDINDYYDRLQSGKWEDLYVPQLLIHN